MVFNRFYHLLIIDPVIPLREIWIVGEGFLKSSFAKLQTMKTSADSQQSPYVYQQFLIKPFYQTGMGSAPGTVHKLYNSLVEAFNKSHKLPHYILMVPDRDIILQLDYFAPGIGFIIEQTDGVVIQTD